MRTAILAAGACLLATPALAQDGPPARGLFTGARVEGRVGFDRAVVTLDDGQDSDSRGESGVVYGGEAGFDFDLNNLVVGAYAGIEGSGVDIGDSTGRLKAGRNITLGGRIGGRVGQRALIYAKGGYSNGRLTAQAGGDEAHQDLDGFHLGGGIEALFGRNFYGKVEYVYTNYNTGDYDDGEFAFDTDLERHQVVGAVGVRF